ncbi:hypothetical protein C8A01DRAFT_42762 [Parachaetomium inaequale]|uniref:DUF7892 domain-containing protein n=1 Tax=Parachaetomium inaequale TaxID=2588326 RepID=A0AAN6PTH5_9PEZI|nr:hypothetical protein C8A01DRAFT_42762 [Parachaetomium inaequale]
MALDNRNTTTASVLHGSAATNGPPALGKKRKSPGDNAGYGHVEATSPRPGNGVKKTKLAEGHAKQGSQSGPALGSRPSPDRSLLPPEIWHYVFTLCPPKSLGKLLAVSKLFNLYLDPASPAHRALRPSATQGALRPMEPNAIWQGSRRLFWPSQMPAPLRSKTELDMWRLACSPRCQDCGRLHVRGPVSSRTSRHPGPGADGVAVIWAFGTRMCAACLVNRSDKELDLLISPSVPSAIIPALPFVFLTQERDVFSATTLEYAQLPADLQVTKLFSKSDVEALQEEFLQVKDMGKGTVGEWLKGLPGRGSDLQHDASKWEKWESSGGVERMCSLLYPGYEALPRVSLPPKPSTNSTLPTLPPQGRHERTAEEAAELKAARKTEIERRSLLLNPPLTADVLRHIPSFQAATQIVAELNEDAWERLKPRLLAQRGDVERMLQGEHKAESTDAQKLLEQPPPEATLAAEKEGRDRIDKDWEDAQAPLRVRIAGYADEVIRDTWGKGKKVTRENCSRFAVDSLLHVRARFYAEVAKDAAAARAAGETPPMDPAEGPFTQKLTLENMKWIFDTKFKPHTEPLRKELFYCNGCEGNYKAFGFEGVIQHYAAKHTSALSLGSIVVHWRAEWPEHPPFSATARSTKAPFRLHAPGGFAAVNGGAPLSANFSYPSTGPLPAPVAPIYPPPMGYGYTPPTYSGHYQQPPPLPQLYQPQPAAPPFAPPPGYEQQPPYATPPAPYPAYQPPAIPYAPPAVEPAPSYVPPQSGQYDYPFGSYQANSAGGQYADLYQTKVDDVARNSRELWRVLGDIRDLPGNVRVFVTIHHLVKRFRSRFYETPPLSMFIDGLSNNKEMRPVRNVNGLVCRTCHLGLGNAASVEQDRADFSLPQLANHFQSKHIEPMQRLQTGAAPLDWGVDMVLVPDLAVLPSIASSATEPQRALLSAAFPAAFQSRQHEQVPAERHPTTAADAWEGSRASSSHTGRPNVTQAVGAGFLADYRISDESPLSTTPGTLSENDRSAHNGDNQHPSQGSLLNGGQTGFQTHKKTAGKNKRGKQQGSGVSGDPVFGKRFKTREEKRTREGKKKREEKWKREEKKKRERADIRAMRAVHQVTTPPVHPSFAGPERPGIAVGPQGQVPRQPDAQASRQLEKSHLAASTNREQEPSIMAALESYLEQRQLPRFQGRQEVPNPALYTNRGDSAVSPDFRSSSGTYARQSDAEVQARPPQPVRRGRSPDGQRVDAVYYPRPMTVERQQDMFGPQRTQASFVEPLPRHMEERLALPAPRQEDRPRTTAPPEADYRQYHEDMRVHSRPPVEAYEIVHVMDEHGEYYIRRPVRREPETRYMYEDRRVRRDADPYPAREPVYAPVSRSSLGLDGVRPSVASDNWPGDRRADPAYYEEYDPRFPAA